VLEDELTPPLLELLEDEEAPELELATEDELFCTVLDELKELELPKPELELPPKLDDEPIFAVLELGLVP
jgi:hypothetical protein